MTTQQKSRISRAATRATDAARGRDQAIREVHADGASIRAIAGAAGISPSRVHQIVQGK